MLPLACVLTYVIYIILCYLCYAGPLSCILGCNIVLYYLRGSFTQVTMCMHQEHQVLSEIC